MSWFTTIASVIYLGGFLFLIYETKKEENKSNKERIKVSTKEHKRKDIK